MIRDISRNLRVRSILSYGQKFDPALGAPVTYIDTHEIHVSADEIILQDNGGVSQRAANIDVRIDINAQGINGLDVGTKSPFTWYHIWVIHGANGPVKGVLSLSSSSPNLPGGYSYKAYVGAVYNNGDDYLIAYYQNGQLAWGEKSCPLAMTTFPTDPTSVDLSASLPSTATSAIIDLSGLTAIGGNFISNIYVGPTLTGPWHNRWMMVAGAPQGTGVIDHVQLATQCEILLDSPQTIYAYVGTANDRLEISVLGWKY